MFTRTNRLAAGMHRFFRSRRTLSHSQRLIAKAAIEASLKSAYTMATYTVTSLADTTSSGTLRWAIGQVEYGWRQSDNRFRIIIDKQWSGNHRSRGHATHSGRHIRCANNPRPRAEPAEYQWASTVECICYRSNLVSIN